MKKILSGLICAGSLLAGTAFATDSFNVWVDTASNSYTVNGRYSGVAFEIGSLSSGNAGVSGYMLNPTNTQLLTLFTNIGLGNIRIGGGSVDDLTPPGFGSDGYTGVDHLFDFAQTAGVNVIYSLRLFCTNSSGLTTYESEDPAIAGHIWSRNSAQVSYFCIGNEPNLYIYDNPTDPYASDYESGGNNNYLATWNTFAGLITNQVPGAHFGGPDSADEEGQTYNYYNGESWTVNFAQDKKNGNIKVPITYIDQHNYVGGSGPANALTAIDQMLSPNWDTGTNQWLYDNILSGVLAVGWNYRMTEANDFSPGVTNASTRFASALWVLDYMYWMAAHGCSGINIENRQWYPNNLFYYDSSKRYQAYPKGLGIRAFNLAAPHNTLKGITNIYNPQNVSATAYAVGNSTDLYLTIINKTHATNSLSTYGYGTNLTTTIYPSGGLNLTQGEYMTMAPATGGPSAPGGTLGGQAITNNAVWNGTWTSLAVTNGSGQCTVSVPGCSAVIVHLY